MSRDVLFTAVIVITICFANASVHAQAPHRSTSHASDPPWLRLRFDPGQSLQIQAPSSQFQLNAVGRIQVLNTQLTNDVRGNFDNDWSIRRARLLLTGRFLSQHNRFKLELAFSPRDLGITDGRVTRSPALSWYLAFEHFRDLSVRIGQFKVPYNRQRVVSSASMQFVDRSIVNAEFNLDRDIGVQLYSRDLFGSNLLRYALFVGVGEGRDGFQQPDLGLMTIGRIEVLSFGTFSDYSESDLSRQSKPRLAFGFAYSFVDNARGNRGILGDEPVDGGSTDTHNLSVDMIFKWLGFSLQSELMWRAGSRNPPGQTSSTTATPNLEKARNGIGAFVQFGYFWKHFELAGRYGAIRGIGDTSLNDQNELGSALSTYIWKHAIKVQLDYFRLWSGAIRQGRDQVRLQLQLMI